jgi:hypothetical protein
VQDGIAGWAFMVFMFQKACSSCAGCIHASCVVPSAVRAAKILVHSMGLNRGLSTVVCLCFWYFVLHGEHLPKVAVWCCIAMQPVHPVKPVGLGERFAVCAVTCIQVAELHTNSVCGTITMHSKATASSCVVFYVQNYAQGAIGHCSCCSSGGERCRY